MRIKIDKLFLNSQISETFIGLTDLPLLNEPFQDIVLDSEVSYKVEVSSLAKGIFALRGRANATFKGACARCLAEVRYNLEVDVNCYFVPACDMPAEDSEDFYTSPISAHLTKEMLDSTYTYTYPVIDLAKPFADQFHLELPLRLLCQPVCEAGVVSNQLSRVEIEGEEGEVFAFLSEDFSDKKEQRNTLASIFEEAFKADLNKQ